MARAAALLLMAAIALAAALITRDALRRSDGIGMTQPPPTAPAAAPRSSPAMKQRLEPAASAELDEPLPALTDGIIRALLARLLTLDGIAALEDDALVRLVAHSLDDVLRVASSLSDPRERTFVLERVADFAVGIDAKAALAAAGALTVDTARAAYTAAALDAWAAIDPGAVLAYVEKNPSSRFDWTPLARFDPYAVITLTERLGAGTADGVGPLEEAQRAALSVWAEEDPKAAAAYADAIPNERWRNVAIQTVARSYARRDARAAWQWVRELDPASLAGMNAVLSTVAQTDIGAALDSIMEVASVDGVQSEGVPGALTLLMLDLGPAGHRRAAGDLLARNDPARLRMFLNVVISRWTTEQPKAALDWVVANAALIGDTAVFNSFAPLASEDPELALQTFRRLPPDLRAAWLAAVGRELARSTPAPTLGALETLAGEPGYGAALVVVAEGLARSEPAEVVRLIEAAPPDARGTAIERAAAALGRFAPEEAVRWARALEHEAESAVVVRGIATGWGISDRQRARDWVLAMPRGAARDAGAGALLESAALSGIVDEILLAQFGSADAQRASVSRVAGTLASRGQPDAARDLAVRFLPTPEERTAVDAIIERVAANSVRADTSRGNTESSTRSGAPRTRPADVLLARPPRRAASARSDEELARQQTVAQRVTARRAAHAASEQLRDDTGGIAALAAGLPGANGCRFVLEALEHLAATDGQDAFAATVALDEPLRSAALRKIGVPWAVRDPYRAIAATDRLTDPDQRHRYTRDVLLTWARADPQGVARYFETVPLDSSTERLMRELEQLILAHPESARIIAARLSGQAP